MSESKKCFLCENETVGHFHCDKCGVSIQDGEDAWFWIGNERICNDCKIKDYQEGEYAC